MCEPTKQLGCGCIAILLKGTQGRSCKPDSSLYLTWKEGDETAFMKRREENPWQRMTHDKQLEDADWCRASIFSLADKKA